MQLTSIILEFFGDIFIDYVLVLFDKNPETDQVPQWIGYTYSYE